MKYWDSSALIPLFVEEPRSEEIRLVLRKDPSMVAWWGTPVECASAIWRLKRADLLSDVKVNQVRERADLLLDEIDLIAPSRLLRERALRLLALHPLRAGDALQLASALRWAQDQTRGIGFVCLDDRLQNAASAEGFTVFPNKET